MRYNVASGITQYVHYYAITGHVSSREWAVSLSFHVLDEALHSTVPRPFPSLNRNGKPLEQVLEHPKREDFIEATYDSLVPLIYNLPAFAISRR